MSIGKSKEDLEKERLQAEIDELKARKEERDAKSKKKREDRAMAGGCGTGCSTFAILAIIVGNLGWMNGWSASFILIISLIAMGAVMGIMQRKAAPTKKTANRLRAMGRDVPPNKDKDKEQA